MMRFLRALARAAVVWPTMLTLGAQGAPPAFAASSDPCRVSDSAVEHWRARPGVAIVDIRAEADFREVRIPGSLNIPAFALRTKAHLRSRPVLLIGRGAVDTATLMERCRSLREQGFTDVGVFDGGLAAWARTVGGLVGDSRAQRQLALLSPATMMQLMASSSPAVGPGLDPGGSSPCEPAPGKVGEADSGCEPPKSNRLLVIDVSPRSVAVEPSLRSRLIRLPQQDGPDLRRAVERAVRKHSRIATVSALVLTDADGARSAELLEIVDQLQLPQVYVLEGGVAAYGRFVAQRQRVSAAADRDCDTCGGR